MSVRSALLLFSLALASPALANPQLVPPAEGQANTHLQVRIVSYDGHTNGGMTIEVTNNGNSPELFTAQGLFFVPDANANQAPQRLGAVGPFKIDGDDMRRDKTTIPAHGKIIAHLDVYCIDSHRSSPSPSTSFHVAKERLPKDLSQGIANDAASAAQPYGGVSSPAPAAKSAVQGQVWKKRNEKWVPLEGEGQQEAGKK
jgi:hypothetical protein